MSVIRQVSCVRWIRCVTVRPTQVRRTRTTTTHQSSDFTRREFCSHIGKLTVHPSQDASHSSIAHLPRSKPWNRLSRAGEMSQKRENQERHRDRNGLRISEPIQGTRKYSKLREKVRMQKHPVHLVEFLQNVRDADATVFSAAMKHGRGMNRKGLIAIMDLMLEKNVKRDRVTYNILFDSLSRFGGTLSDLQYYLSLMKSDGIPPNSVTLSSALNVCGSISTSSSFNHSDDPDPGPSDDINDHSSDHSNDNMDAVIMAESIWKRMILDFGVQPQEPAVVSLLNVYAHHRRLSPALRLFEEMKKSSKNQNKNNNFSSSSLILTPSLYGAMMNVLKECGEYIHLEQMFQEMVNQPLMKPNCIHFSILLSALNKQSKFVQCLQLWKKMTEEYGLIPNDSLWCLLTTIYLNMMQHHSHSSSSFISSDNKNNHHHQSLEKQSKMRNRLLNTILKDIPEQRERMSGLNRMNPRMARLHLDACIVAYHQSNTDDWKKGRFHLFSEEETAKNNCENVRIIFEQYCQSSENTTKKSGNIDEDQMHRLLDGTDLKSIMFFDENNGESSLLLRNEEGMKDDWRWKSKSSFALLGYLSKMKCEGEWRTVLDLHSYSHLSAPWVLQYALIKHQDWVKQECINRGNVLILIGKGNHSKQGKIGQISPLMHRMLHDIVPQWDCPLTSLKVFESNSSFLVIDDLKDLSDFLDFHQKKHILR